MNGVCAAAAPPTARTSAKASGATGGGMRRRIGCTSGMNRPTRWSAADLTVTFGPLQTADPDELTRCRAAGRPTVLRHVQPDRFGRHDILGSGRPDRTVSRGIRKDASGFTPSSARPQMPGPFEAEALTYLDSLYRTARRLTRDPTDADDLVQDTY